MKGPFIVVFVFLCFGFANAQNWNKEVLCSDTLFTFAKLGVRECQKKTAFSFRFDIGRAQFYYQENTAQWIGNHGAINFGIYGALHQYVIGARLKGFTITPQKELLFGEEVMTGEARLNHFKTEFYFGYSFDFKYNFSVEPNLGISKMSFNVINEEELTQYFNIPNNYGAFAGFTLNKYFRLEKNVFLSLYFSANYGQIDYSTVHPELRGGYLDWTAGIAIKGAFERKFESVFNL